MSRATTKSVLASRKQQAMDRAAGNSLGRDAWRRLSANRAAMTSLGVLVFITLAVIIGPWLTSYDYFSQDYDAIWQAPSLATGHWFGTDQVGRDLFARTLTGGRISLMVGIVTTLVSLVIGVTSVSYTHLTLPTICSV